MRRLRAIYSRGERLRAVEEVSGAPVREPGIPPPRRESVFVFLEEYEPDVE